eukprot:6058220-Prymnesium_polylepis.2
MHDSRHRSSRHEQHNLRSATLREEFSAAHTASSDRTICHECGALKNIDAPALRVHLSRALCDASVDRTASHRCCATPHDQAATYCPPSCAQRRATADCAAITRQRASEDLQGAASCIFLNAAANAPFNRAIAEQCGSVPDVRSTTNGNVCRTTCAARCQQAASACTTRCQQAASERQN